MATTGRSSPSSDPGPHDAGPNLGPPARPERRRRYYDRYLRSRVKIQFHRKPPLGWIYDKTQQIYVFPRDERGNVLFDTKYWRGMFGNCLAVHFRQFLD